MNAKEFDVRFLFFGQHLARSILENFLPAYMYVASLVHFYLLYVSTHGTVCFNGFCCCWVDATSGCFTIGPQTHSIVKSIILESLNIFFPLSYIGKTCFISSFILWISFDLVFFILAAWLVPTVHKISLTVTTKSHRCVWSLLLLPYMKHINS